MGSYQPSPNRPEVHIISSVTIGLQLVIVVNSFLIFIQVVKKGNKRKEDEGKYTGEERYGRLDGREYHRQLYVDGVTKHKSCASLLVRIQDSRLMSYNTVIEIH